MEPQHVNRLPSLDGLRAVSIVLVLGAHLTGTRYYPVPDSWVFHEYAQLGVRIFFVISGFLITSLLLKEREKTGRVDLRGFYRRRFYRIMPVAYLYMLTVAITAWGTLPVRDIAGAFTYTINFNTHATWLLGHFWSLANEEQFYLLWPCVLAFCFHEVEKGCDGGHSDCAHGTRRSLAYWHGGRKDDIFPGGRRLAGLGMFAGDSPS